jgi:beta-galactosidase
MIGMSPAFAENSERMLVEMIRQHFNHPSIFFWGYMNEVLLVEPKPLPAGYYQAVPPLVRRLENRARAEDPSRKTVMALSRDEIRNDRGIGDIPHILGLNLYFGWYYEQLDSLGPFLDRLHAARPSRPLIVSEYGADSDERVHTRKARAFDFSSEYQQVFHTSSFPQMEARPFVMGTAVWNQFDFGSAGRQDTKFALNQKGLYFYDRTPKDVAFYYRAALRDEPVLYIAREWNVRAGDSRQEVWVYSNAPEVELFVNGRPAGKRAVKNRTARWDVELVEGPNRIRAVAGSLIDEIEIAFSDRASGSYVAVNAGAEYAHTDIAKVVWETDRGFIGGDVVRTYHRIFSTNEDPLFQAARVGMSGYQFDVPDGTYEVTLGFAEVRRDGAPGQHVFTVRVNGEEIFRDLDLMRDFGAYTAAMRTIDVEAKGAGVRIEFDAKTGKASIAAIKIRRIG